MRFTRVGVVRDIRPLSRFPVPEASMSTYFPTAEECGRVVPFPGVSLATCSLERVMMAVVDLEPHSVVTEHCHPHEQMGMLLEGRATFTIGGESRELRKGDLYRIPGNVLHKVVVHEEPTRALDIFSPPRDDYR